MKEILGTALGLGIVSVVMCITGWAYNKLIGSAEEETEEDE
jgi:hypothetical protein